MFRYVFSLCEKEKHTVSQRRWIEVLQDFKPGMTHVYMMQDKIDIYCVSPTLMIHVNVSVQRFKRCRTEFVGITQQTELRHSRCRSGFRESEPGCGWFTGPFCRGAANRFTLCPSVAVGGRSLSGVSSRKAWCLDTRRPAAQMTRRLHREIDFKKQANLLPN